MTLKILFQSFIIFFWFFPAQGQGEFQQVLSKLKFLDLPVIIGCDNELDTLMTNRFVAWKYLITPATKMNSQKTEENQFPIDSSVINLYGQWENIDWTISEAVNLYTPTFSGDLYCGSYLKFSETLFGIFWIIKEKDPLYGSGSITYLFIYNELGEAIDFLSVSRCLEGGSPLERFKIHDLTQITFDSILITLSKSQDTLTDKLISGKKNIQNRKFSITHEGRIEEITK